MERISLLASVAVLPALLAAALLLVARIVAVRYQLASPSVDAILTATGVSRSRAYELATRLLALAPALLRAPGRPAKESVAAAASSDTGAITRTVLTYVMRHPGCVDRSVRQRYSDGFRRFVLDLCTEHLVVEVEAMAAAVAVPVGTLKDWLRTPRAAVADVSAESTARPLAATADEPTTHDVDGVRIQSVLEAWRRWCGSFVDFCEHVRRDLRIPFGRDLLRRILETAGLRRTAHRAGRSSNDESALRDSFRTYFPGAQWVGDGMQVPVVLADRRFLFNVELDVDAHTAAFVGVSVRDAEDSAAVVEAFEAGVRTTGAPPLALLLDNRPSNHTSDVDAALGDTLRIRATPARPQNKAHVEGAFGLFSQALPPLIFDLTGDVRDRARRLLALVVEVWAKTTNHRPRKGRDGRSRVDLYAEGEPTDEQIAEARLQLRELTARQELARRTAEARRRPELLALLDEEFARLELLDPERHLRIAIAGYPKTAIIDGLLIFESKVRCHTLPDGADARYLLGIVKNVTAKTEGEVLAELLYDGRIKARDRFLAPLRAERDQLRTDTDVAHVLATCADRALETASNLERTFWLDTMVDVLREQPEPHRKVLFLQAARRIEATFSAPPRERHDAVRFVADRLLPVE